MAKEIRRSPYPYTFTVELTDWGWQVFGRHDVLGSVSVLEQEDHEPPLSDVRFSALWDLIDEQLFARKADAERAARDWLKTLRPPATP